MDNELKEKFETLCGVFGMNPSVAMTIFAKAVVRERRIPFEITAGEDPFWSEANIAHLRAAVADVKAGKYAVHDLIDEDGVDDKSMAG
jgi:DNA-damage-inducible protein J